jgi:AcrR family transcriptional regulator
MAERSREGAAAKRSGRAERPRRAAPRTNDEWSAATIEGLVRLARREFATHGYGGASVDRIAAAAELTKGAVYYHFHSKAGLFEAVLRQVQRDLSARIEASAGRRREPLAAVHAGCEAFLELAIDDELRQIVLADGPAVLGWSKWRAIDAEHGLGSLKDGLRVCHAAGVLAVAAADVDVLAHWLSGAMNEAVFMIAEATDRTRALTEAKRALSTLLSGLTAPRPVRAPAGRRRPAGPPKAP